MGNMTVDEYYRKFMEFVKYCPDEVPTEEKKMLRFELGLPYEVQKLIDSSNYTTLDQLYKRAAQVGGIVRKEKQQGGGSSSHVGEKRRENFPNQQGNGKKNKTFGRFNDDKKGNRNNTGGNRTSAKERYYYCKRCHQNHPGKDCDGNLVDCNHCGKKGHRAYECYEKVGYPEGWKSGKARQQEKNGNGNAKTGGFNGKGQQQRDNNASGQRLNFQGTSGTTNLGSSVAAPSGTGRVTALNSKEAEKAKDVVTGTFSVSNKQIKVLFDSGASYSFISESKCEALGLKEPEDVSYYVSVPSGDLHHCTKMFKSVPLKIRKVEFPTDVYVMDMEDLDLILGMYWIRL